MIMAQASSASSEELHQEADDHLRWLLDESGALLQAEHRQDRLHRNETYTADVTVTHEFISSIVNRMAA
jgi:hypothetical protein